MTDDFMNDFLTNGEAEEASEDLSESPEAPAEKRAKRVIRQNLVDQGITLSDIEAFREAHQLTEEQVASGNWMYLSEFWLLARAEGATNGQLKRAMGNDRSMDPPLNADFQIMWVGKRKWISRKALSEANIQELLASGQRRTKADAPPPEGLHGVTKKEMVALAGERGIEVDAKAKREVIEATLLEAGVVRDDFPI